jgi:O-antigen ligase
LKAGRSGGSREGRTTRSAAPEAAARAAIWLVCVAPVAILPGAYNRWAWPTLILAVAAAVAAAVAPAVGRLPKTVVVTVSTAFGLLVLAALLGAAPVAQVFGRAPRYEGLVALPVLIAVIWVGARVLGPRVGSLHLKDAMIALATASGLLAVVALLEALGLRPIETDLVRPGSLAGNATDQGILGALFLAVLANMALGAWRRTGAIAWWAVAGSAAGLVAVATSASRAAALAAVVVVLALACRFVVTSTRPSRAALVGAGAVGVFVALMLVLPYTRERILGVDDLARRTIEDRVIMWGQAWDVFVTSPWLGVGPSGFADAVTGSFGDDWYQRASVGVVLDSPHNIVLQILVAGGVVGLVVAAALVTMTVVFGIRNLRTATAARRDLLTGALVALPAGGLALLTTVSSPKTLMPLALLAGCLLALAPAVAATRVLVDRARVGILAVWLGVLVVWTAGDVFLLNGVRSSAQGDFAAADDAFSAASALRPWDADVTLVAASSLTSALGAGLNGAADDAARWAAASVDRLPESSRAWELAGVVALQRGDLAASAAALERASELSPADPRIWHERGLAAFAARDLVSAQAALVRAVELAPDSRSSWDALADVCEQVGDAQCVGQARDALASLGT